MSYFGTFQDMTACRKQSLQIEWIIGEEGLIVMTTSEKGWQPALYEHEASPGLCDLEKRA